MPDSPAPLALPEKDRIPGLDCRLTGEDPPRPGESRREIEVTIPAAVFEEEIEKELRRIRQRTRLRGFRKGKAPRERIELLFGEEATEAAMSRLLARATKQSLAELDVHPLEAPQATPGEAERGKPLTARLAFSVWPDVGTVAFEGIQVVTQPRPVTESDIGKVLERIRQDRAEPGPLPGRGVQDGDLVVGDLAEASALELDPSASPQVTKDLALQVGSDAYHPALHEALLGASEGETVVVTAQFGAESPDPERAGRSIRAAFTIREARTTALPALDDSLARAIGASSLLALRGDIRDQLRKQAKEDEERQVTNQLVAGLREKNPLEPPEPLIARDLDHRVKALATSMVRNGMPAEQVRAEIEKHLAPLRAECERNVAAFILVDALADQQGIEVSDQAVEDQVAEEAASAGKNAAALRAALEKDGGLEHLRTLLRREAALAFLRERVEFLESPE